MIFGFVVPCIGCYQGQALYAQMVGDDLFESGLDLFKIILHDYRKVFRRCVIVKRAQGFFLCGQVIEFLQRLLRSIVVRDGLPEEIDWEGLLSFDFTASSSCRCRSLWRRLSFAPRQ